MDNNEDSNKLVSYLKKNAKSTSTALNIMGKDQSLEDVRMQAEDQTIDQAFARKNNEILKVSNTIIITVIRHIFNLLHFYKLKKNSNCFFIIFFFLTQVKKIYLRNF